MYVSSTFGMIVKQLPRRMIEKLAEEHKSDRYYKSLDTRCHLMTMLAAQFSGLDSLRGVEAAVNAHPHRHYHSGLERLCRSTLSDANKGRDAGVFKSIAQHMMQSAGAVKHELGKLLTVIDSTPIMVGARGNGWAVGSRPGSRGLKLHVAHQAGDIEYAEITDANVNDITQAQAMPLTSGRIYVCDKGYCDYNWWQRIAESRSLWVTRAKRNAALRVEEILAINEADRDFILNDEIVSLTVGRPRGGKTNQLAGVPLRRIQIPHPSRTGETLTILSNAMENTAADIAGWYKHRWSVELLFKWLKQNLRINRFMGESRNAMLIQIYTAIIAYLLLKTHQAVTGQTTNRLKDILTVIRLNLFHKPPDPSIKSPTNPSDQWELALC